MCSILFVSLIKYYFFQEENCGAHECSKMGMLGFEKVKENPRHSSGKRVRHLYSNG